MTYACMLACSSIAKLVVAVATFLFFLSNLFGIVVEYESCVHCIQFIYYIPLAIVLDVTFTFYIYVHIYC